MTTTNEPRSYRVLYRTADFVGRWVLAFAALLASLTVVVVLATVVGR